MGAMDEPQEEPQLWAAGRAGSGVAGGALTGSPRPDVPSGGMLDITLHCQGSQKGCPAQQRGLVPRWLSSEKDGSPSSSWLVRSHQGEQKLRAARADTPSISQLKPAHFEVFEAWQFSPSLL